MLQRFDAFVPVALALCLSSCITAWQDVGATIVVDEANGPGAHFTDIPAAVAAAAPGDLVLVRPGEYSSFLVNKAITIVGAPNGAARVTRAALTPMTIVGGIPAGEVAVIADLAFPSTVGVWGTRGTVALDACTIGRLIVPLADDVRVYRAADIDRVEVQRSHVEIVSSKVGGGVAVEKHVVANAAAAGTLLAQLTNEHDWPTVALSSTSKLVCARTSVRGRHVYIDADYGWFFSFAQAFGTSASQVDGESTLVTIGTQADVVRGGDSALQSGVPYTDIVADGFPIVGWAGHGVVLESGQVVRSGVQMLGGVGVELTWVYPYLLGVPTSDGLPVAGAQASNVVPITPDNPTLELLDTPTPGSKVRLRVRGPVGSEVVVAYGSPTIVTVPATRPIETLVATVDRIRPGNVPSAGEMTFEVDVPAAVEVGSHVFLQAHLILPNGAARASNSVLLVAR